MIGVLGYFQRQNIILSDYIDEQTIDVSLRLSVIRHYQITKYFKWEKIKLT